MDVFLEPRGSSVGVCRVVSRPGEASVEEWELSRCVEDVYKVSGGGLVTRGAARTQL